MRASHGPTAHCLLVTCEPGDQIAIKSGFGSGYGGTGPHALADALLVLHASNIEVQEVEVSKALLDRLDDSALTRADIELIAQTRPVRPSRWTEYVVAIHGVEGFDKSVWRNFKPVMPWAIIDARITDLALEFFHAPDKAIMTGFRRLEDLVRTRTTCHSTTGIGTKALKRPFIEFQQGVFRHKATHAKANKRV